MLPDQVMRLLTAFVDGELSEQERQYVLRLLNQSAEAREFVRQLQENAHKVRSLPPRKVEESLVEDVLVAIAEMHVQHRPVPKRRWWVPVAAVVGLAACFLIGVLTVLYFQSLKQHEHPGKHDHAGQHDPTDKKGPSVQHKDIPPIPKKENPLMAALVEGAFGGFVAPVVEERPFATSFAELQRGNTTGQFVHELSRKQIVQLDIKVKDNPLAIERLKAALHEQGIKTIIDADAGKALKKKNQAKIAYTVYAENMSTEQVAKLLKDLSLPDTSGLKKSVPTPYEKLTMTPLAKPDKSRLAKTLGIDIDKTTREGKAPARWERSAVVMPVHAGVKQSAELRQFAKQRRVPQAGTVQLLIKIHQD